MGRPRTVFGSDREAVRADLVNGHGQVSAEGRLNRRPVQDEGGGGVVVGRGDYSDPGADGRLVAPRDAVLGPGVVRDRTDRHVVRRAAWRNVRGDLQDSTREAGPGVLQEVELHVGPHDRCAAVAVGVGPLPVAIVDAGAAAFVY